MRVLPDNNAFKLSSRVESLLVKAASSVRASLHRASSTLSCSTLAPDEGVIHAHVTPRERSPSSPAGSPYAKLLALASTHITETRALAMRHSLDGSGLLDYTTMAEFFQELNPSMKQRDAELAALLIDVKRCQVYDVERLLGELLLVDAVYNDNMAGRDDDGVLARMHAYLSSNRDGMQQAFDQVSEGGNGKLDTDELCLMMGTVPGFDVDELRYIMVHLNWFANTAEHRDALLVSSSSHETSPQATELDGAHRLLSSSVFDEDAAAGEHSFDIDRVVRAFGCVSSSPAELFPQKTSEEQDTESGERIELLHSEEHDRDRPSSYPGTPPTVSDYYTISPPLKPPAKHVPPKAPKHEVKVHNSFSDRRSPHEEPFQRLILVSSRTPNAEKVVDAALTDCAVGLYDWKRFTPSELLEHVKSMLGGCKVDSIAVIASGSKAGGVGLLEGHQTTARTLSKKKDELAQFWKRLASNVVSDSGRKGSIHLLSCRVTEAAQDGAELLAMLQKQTNLEVLASDDHRDGYPISQSCQAEDGSYYLSVSGEHAMDLYFDAGRPTQAVTVAPALIDGPTPAHRAGKLAPLGDAAPKHAQPIHAHAPPPPIPVSPYAELLALAHTNMDETKAMVFRHSSDGNGLLSFPTITSFFQEVNPSMKNPELVALMIDLKRSQSFDVDHLLEELQLVDKVYKDNMAGRDDDAVLERLHAYLSSNKDIMQQVFDLVDKDGSGKLDMHELCQLVGMIPGLDVSEVRYVLINLMTKRDLYKDSKLSLDELCSIIR